MKAVLVLNGEPPSATRLQQLAASYPVYAADGGGAVCLAAGVRPQWVAGDFDSIGSIALPSDWTFWEFPEQDRTDFQKLLASLPEGINDLLILGGMGKRADHFTSNLLIATELPPGWSLCFECGEQQLIRVTPACDFSADVVPGKTLSLLPMATAGAVTTRGLKWDLQEADMGPGLQLGQSNVVEGPVEVRVGAGCLFVWVERAL